MIRREDPMVLVARLRGELLQAIARLAEEFGCAPVDVEAELERRRRLGDLTETAAVTLYMSVHTCLYEAERDALLA